MKPKRVREGFCELCGKETTVRYRVQTDGETWRLVCPACTEELRAAYPETYRYGGTWKAHKRH